MIDRLKKLPHYRLIFAGGVVLLVVGFMVYDSTRWSVRNNSPEFSSSSTQRPTVNPEELDTDGDGLPDWKERIYGTDINNPDTDGDGTSDGDEVIAGRDPRKAGPNDAFRYLGDIGTTTGGIAAERREFLEKFLRARSREIQEDVFRQITNRFDPRPFRPRLTLSDLNIVSGNATSTMREFGNAFGRIIDSYTSAGVISEDDIIKKMMGVKEKPEAATRVLSELELPAINYRNFASALAKIPVPIELSKYHLAIVNGYDVMSRGLLGMRDLYVDPVQGAGAYEAYLINKANVTVGYAALVHEFGKRGIFFEPNEPGAVFTWTPTALKEARKNAQ
jgi:hypothetical protein